VPSSTSSSFCRRRRRFVVVVVIVVVFFFFPHRVFSSLVFSGLCGSRLLDRSLDRSCLELPRRIFSVINILVETRICGNLTEREEDQFTARFLVAIFGFFWVSWLAVLSGKAILYALSFISFETPAGTRDDNWLAISVFLVFHSYRRREVLHCGLISDGNSDLC